MAVIEYTSKKDVGLIVTVAEAEVEPPEPVQVSMYLVLNIMFVIFSVPPTTLLFLIQLPVIGPLPEIDAKHLVALDTTQVKVVAPLFVTDVGDAVSVTVGAGVVTVLLVVDEPGVEVAIVIGGVEVDCEDVADD